MTARRSAPSRFEEETLSDLIRECRKGDEQAWATLFAMFRPRIMAVAREWSVESASVEDVIQETFLRLVSAIHSLRQPKTASAYICRTAQHVCIDRVRRFKAQKRGAGKGALSLEELQEAGGAILQSAPEDEESFSEEQFTALERCLRELPADDRKLITMKFIESREYSEIGRVMKCAPGTLAVRTFRILRRLRKRMEMEQA